MINLCCCRGAGNNDHSVDSHSSAGHGGGSHLMSQDEDTKSRKVSFLWHPLNTYEQKLDCHPIGLSNLPMAAAP